jgi:hypothetical protein
LQGVPVSLQPKIKALSKVNSLSRLFYAVSSFGALLFFHASSAERHNSKASYGNRYFNGVSDAKPKTATWLAR